MAVYKGVITRIGACSSQGSLTVTSLLTIGDNELRDIIFDDYMYNYLKDAVTSGEPVKIAIPSLKDRQVVAIHINGKSYYHKNVTREAIKPGFFEWALAIVLGLFSFGIGFVIAFVGMRYRYKKLLNMLDEFDKA